MKRDPVKATVTTPEAVKPRKRPRLYAVVYYDVDDNDWYTYGVRQSHEDAVEDAADVRQNDFVDPASIRIVEIPGSEEQP